jgi:6-phosphogluconolactonase
LRNVLEKDYVMSRYLGFFATTILLFASYFGHGASHAPVPRFAYVANNQDDTVSIFAIRGYRLQAVGYVYTGSGSNPRSVVVTPLQSFLYVAEGSVGIAGYAINNINGSLTPVLGSPFLTGPEFSIAMHPTGKFLVAVSGSSITVYAIDPSSGSLTSIQTASGDSPVSAAIDPTGSFLFTANVNSNSVSAFTINQNTGILTSVPGSPFTTGPSPQSVAIEHGKFLYVPNGNGASISAYAINSTTGALTQVPGSPFSTGSVPVAAVTKNSFLFVGNSADKTVSQYAIDKDTGVLTQIASPFSTGSAGPLGLAASPTEPLLYVADHDSDEVLVLGITKAGVLFNESSMRSRGRALSIALASGDAKITYSPKFVYECNGTSNDIWGYRATGATGSLQSLGSPFKTGASPQVVVSDLSGTFIFTANAGSNDVSVFTINAQTGALVSAPGSPYPAGSQPSSVVVDNGAHYIYVANSVSNTISGYSVGPNGALTAVPGSPFANPGAGPRSLAIDPRGKFLYVANSQSNTVSVYEIDAGTGGLQFVASNGAGTLPLAVTPNFDGKYLYVLNQSSENISAYGIDSVTGQLLPLKGSPFDGARSSNSIAADSLGERLYTGELSSIIGYRSFDNRGSLGLLKQSPFSGVSGAFGLSIDLSDSFLYAANNTGNTISGFQVDRTTGDLYPLIDSPYPAGTNPTSITVVNNFQ